MASRQAQRRAPKRTLGVFMVKILSLIAPKAIRFEFVDKERDKPGCVPEPARVFATASRDDIRLPS